MQTTVTDDDDDRQTDTAVNLEVTSSSSGSAATASSPDVHPTDALAALGNTNADDLGEKHGCPKQPALPQFPSKCFGSTKRSFSTYFYKNYPWLEYSVRKDSVYCFACRHFQTESCVEETFRKGMSDWKKLSSKLEKHGKSQAHLNCMIKMDR